MILWTPRLDGCNGLAHTLPGLHLALNFPAKLDIGHVSLYLSRVQSEYDRLAALALQLCSHVAKRLVQSGFACCVDGEPVFFWSKSLNGPGVGAYENQASKWYAGLEECLRGDDWSYGVGGQMQIEVCVRATMLMSGLGPS